MSLVCYGRKIKYKGNDYQIHLTFLPYNLLKKIELFKKSLIYKGRKFKFIVKNSKVFEQKGDLLNFKANIDPMALLRQVKPS